MSADNSTIQFQNNPQDSIKYNSRGLTAEEEEQQKEMFQYYEETKTRQDR